MRYYHEKPEIYTRLFGETYACNHPVYNRCTVFRDGSVGLAVIQQRFDPIGKRTWWDCIDPWLNDVIYLNPDFKDLFSAKADAPTDGVYPTITIRQLMWKLRMKPIKKERWETCFDRKDI